MSPKKLQGLPQWADWCKSLLVTAATFVALLCPIALTCVRSETIRAELLGFKHIVQCVLSPDNGEAVLLVVSHAGMLRNSEHGTRNVICTDRRIVTCNLKDATQPARVLLEYPCLDLWGWHDRQKRLLLSSDIGQLASFSIGSAAGPATKLPRTLINVASVHDVQVSPNFDLCLINDGGQLVCHPWRDREQLGPPLWQSQRNIESFAFLPESNQVAVARREGDMHHLFLIDALTGQDVGKLRPMPYEVDRIGVLANSKQLLVVSGHRAGFVSWEIGTGTVEQSLEAWIETGISNLACVAPDEQIAITTSADGMQLIAWHVPTRQQVRSFCPCDSVLIGAKFLDGHRFVTWGTDDQLRVWDWNSSEPERVVRL